MMPAAVDVEHDVDVEGVMLVDLMQIPGVAHDCYINII